MKKCLIISIIITFLNLLTSCNTSEETMKSSLTETTKNLVEESTQEVLNCYDADSLIMLSENYTVENIKEDGGIVVTDFFIEDESIIVWNQFLKSVEEGKASKVRFAYSNFNIDEYGIMDIAYEDGKYIYSHLVEGELVQDEYQYLQSWEENFVNMWVLVNDENANNILCYEHPEEYSYQILFQQDMTQEKIINTLNHLQYRNLVFQEYSKEEALRDGVVVTNGLVINNESYLVWSQFMKHKRNRKSAFVRIANYEETLNDICDIEFGAAKYVRNCIYVDGNTEEMTFPYLCELGHEIVTEKGTRGIVTYALTMENDVTWNSWNEFCLSDEYTEEMAKSNVCIVSIRNY